MWSDVCRISEEILPMENCSKFSDETDLFLKKLETLKDVMQSRGDIFSKKKEKYQQFVNLQIQNTEKKKEQYLKKNNNLTNKIEENNAQLAELNRSLSQLKVKLSQEKSISELLNQRISLLQSDSKKQVEKFNKTVKNYLTVIKVYQDFLNMTIDLDKENPKIVSLRFKGSMNFDENFYVEIEILNDGNFKVLKIYPSLDDDEIPDKCIKKRELMLLLYKVQNCFGSTS